ncbi:MAG: hypothetical protein ACPGTS_01240 [Minisyncoccia bacterium]
MKITEKEIQEIFDTYADVIGLVKDKNTDDSMKSVSGISFENFKKAFKEITTKPKDKITKQ